MFRFDESGVNYPRVTFLTCHKFAVRVKCTIISWIFFYVWMMNTHLLCVEFTPLVYITGCKLGSFPFVSPNRTSTQLQHDVHIEHWE